MSTQIVLNDRKNPYLNQATQKIIAKFSYRKKFENKKFHTQKLLQSSPSLEIISSDRDDWGGYSEIISEYPPTPLWRNCFLDFSFLVAFHSLD